MKTSAEVGQRYLPTINITQLPTAILRLQKEVKDFLKCEDSLIEIGSDGHVDDNEALQYKNVMKELDEVVEAIMALKFSKED